MPAPASKVAWRLLAACAIANAVSLSSPALAQSAATRADAPPHAQSAERQDSFYCEERRLGYWFYCDRPKPPEQDEPASAASATSQLDAITTTLRELKAKAILEPTPANVTAYIRFQRAQLDRASLFSDVWQRAIWQDPELDYTLQRPVSTLGKRQWQDSRSAERNAAMAQLSERYGLFYFFAQSCGACEVMSPIVQSVASTWRDQPAQPHGARAQDHASGRALGRADRPPHSDRLRRHERRRAAGPDLPPHIEGSWT